MDCRAHRGNALVWQNMLVFSTFVFRLWIEEVAFQNYYRGVYGIHSVQAFICVSANDFSDGTVCYVKSECRTQQCKIHTKVKCRIDVYDFQILTNKWPTFFNYNYLNMFFDLCHMLPSQLYNLILSTLFQVNIQKYIQTAFQDKHMILLNFDKKNWSIIPLFSFKLRPCADRWSKCFTKQFR